MGNAINKPLIIIGGSGHGCVIEACVNDNRNRYKDYEWEIKGYCNDYDTEIDGYPVLGKLCDIPALLDKGYYFAWGIHMVGRTIKTASVFESINIPDDRWATIIHKTAFIDSSVVLEPGVFVMYNAYIAPRTRVGKCTLIKANTNIGHDVVIGPVSHVSMGSAIVSCSTIGYCCMIAVNSTILAHSKMGDYSTLGAASLLNGEIPAKKIYVGSPAKYLKDMSNE